MATEREFVQVTGEYTVLDGQQYYRIANSHLMPDFFMSVVGASDHWMFISSSGALTAGRRNPDLALFPYAPDDQIEAARAATGPCTLVRMRTEDAAPRDGRTRLWEPFALPSTDPGPFHRNLYKTPLGHKLVFEEVHELLHLAFRYRWVFSQRFGFVRSCRLENTGREACHLDLLDGLTNVLPYGVGSDFVMRFSNLANAYKKSELIPDSNVGLFYMSSIPTDRAEPSEGLQSTIVWQTGLTPNAILLSATQMRSFRTGDVLQTETDVRGRPGAYLVCQPLTLAPGDAIEWHVVADLAQDHCDIVGWDDWLRRTSDPAAEILDDIYAGEQKLLRIVSSSDAIQCGRNMRRCHRHLSNTVYNVMRGGVPLENYCIHADNFSQHVANFNRETYRRNRSFLANLPSVLSADQLRCHIAECDDPNLTRLGWEYLPLAFSRRHGDPTRPWNRFSIDLESEQGRTSLNYQGNWRDIFQNWEALLVSFPEFSTAMVCRFVNATTADGYNPYRLTKDGFEWEEPTPRDPWANIGYWGDHQIIYLLKLLEWTRRFRPQALDELLNAPVFVHSHVPYRIKAYEQIREDTRCTIDFDVQWSAKIAERIASLGADGKLLRDQRGDIHHVTLVEKILTLSLAKLSNFIPGGGIWMNTQRPEWNDANNALVGTGLSMVTACYLHRWFKFLRDWISNDGVSSDVDGSFRVSQEVANLFDRIGGILREHEHALSSPEDTNTRLQITEALSRAGSDYRNDLYEAGPTGNTKILSRHDCVDLFETARRHLEATIRNNKRPDGLYHAYNLLDWQHDGVAVEHLCEMLEGQVAALSSGLLTPTDAVQLLDALRNSALYRQDQDSYLLYPDRRLPKFLAKNQISDTFVESNPLLQKLLANGDQRIVKRDVRGGIHFNGRFRNSADLQTALARLEAEYGSDIKENGPHLIQIFDEIFGHRYFTGRSGTFFAYEGLGSIYWHMVSKLGLAVSENFFWAVEGHAPQKAVEALRSHFRAIRRGIGAEKSPAEYGAFPSDPYSHTPECAGVKQPGMTGQVKEDILARWSEIGIHIADGCLSFRLDLFDHEELLNHASELTFCDLTGEVRSERVPGRGFGFTLFQVPITYQAGNADNIRIHFANHERLEIDGLRIDQATSRQLFSRSGKIRNIQCRFTALR